MSSDSIQITTPPLKVHGLLNKHSPYIGYFHYSPPHTRSINLYFYDNFTPIEEVERRKRIRLHPYTGNFHFAPGKYSDLHGLEKYRKSRWKNSAESIPDDEENDEIESTDGKDILFENFLKKMKNFPPNATTTTTIMTTTTGSGGLPATTTSSALLASPSHKGSSDDSFINTYKPISRINSDVGLKSAMKQLPSSDSLDKLVSWNSRKHGGNGRHHRESDPSPGLDAQKLQKSLRKWKDGKGNYYRRSVQDCVTPPTSPERDRDRLDSEEIYYEWFPSPHPPAPLPRSNSPTYVFLAPPPTLSTSSSISSTYSSSSATATASTTTPGPSFIDPKSSWQVHTPDGSNNLYIQNNRTLPGGLRNTKNFLTDNYVLMVDKVLGEGSYAKAYLGKSIQSGGYVAIKVISKTINSVEEELRFKREIDNQTRLWHHNVVTVRDVYESLNYIYIVMDYCPGGTLDGILQLRRRLDEEETRFIAYQLICGIGYVHDNGVLHGDIKPANVMFQPQSISSSSSSSSSGSDGSTTTINRVDLLYEKRRREGKLTIALNQAPEVDYQAVKVEKSGGSNGNSQNQKNADLQRDAKTAVIRERLVRGRDVVSTTPLQSTGKTRRNTLAGPEASSLNMAGGASGFAAAAHRNHFRRKKKAVIAAAAPPLSTSPPPPPPPSATTQSSISGSSISSDGTNASSSESLTATMEQDLAYQGHIRYKCPYGMLLKICDFGLSQKVPDVKHYKITGDIHKAPYTPGGTEGYLAPEVMQQRPYGTAADMWAIGTVLYKCLAGTLPFIPATACLEREVKFNGVVWKKVSQNCKDLIASLLTLDEAARPSAKQCLNHAWFVDILLISAVIIPHDAGMDSSDTEDC